MRRGRRLAPDATSPAPIPAADACSRLGGASSSSSLAILNGADCPTDRSSVVLLNMRGASGQSACTGTVVAPNRVLTAAHCLDEGVATVRVWLGSGDQIGLHPSARARHQPALNVPADNGAAARTS